MIDTFTAAQIRELRRLQQAFIEQNADHANPAAALVYCSGCRNLAERIAELEKLLEEGK